MNVLAAAVACARRCFRRTPFAGDRSFFALPHRLEKIAEIGGVAFYKHSQGDHRRPAACPARVPGRHVWLILGGKDKGGDFSSLVPLLRDRAAGVLTLGEAAETIERQIGGAVSVVRAGEMETAVREAARLAAPSHGVVLLAPACASFDQYRNFEERGEHFRRIVRRSQELSCLETLKRTSAVLRTML